MSHPVIREIFFDWDGTFANTETISLAVTRQVLTEYANGVFGKPMTEALDRIEMRGKDFGQIGREFETLVNALHPASQQVTIDIEDLRINKLRPLSKEALLSAELAPHIGPAIAELQDDMGVGLSIASNSPRLRFAPLLAHHGHDARIPASRLFSAFEDVAGKLKPHPAIYELAMNTTGAKPEESAAVEDSVTGMTAATAAKMGLRVGFTGFAAKHEAAELKQKLLDAGAHVVINSMTELPAAVKAYNAGKFAPSP